MLGDTEVDGDCDGEALGLSDGDAEAEGLIDGETEVLGLGVADGLTQSSDIEFFATTVIISEALFIGFERKSRYTAVVTGSKCFAIDRCFSVGISNLNPLALAPLP